VAGHDDLEELFAGIDLIAAKTSEKPGDARFATAAVPLSAAWLTSVGLTIHGW